MSDIFEEITPLFPEGKRKAFTLSSDDGVTQDRRLTDLMRKYRIRGTFHLNSGLMGEEGSLVQDGVCVRHDRLKKEEIAEIYDGFEIAAHTVTHPDLTKLSSSQAAYEIEEDKKELEGLIQAPVKGLSYPYGAYSEKVKRLAAKSGIAYARTVKCTDRFELPEDFLAWGPTCHYCDKKRMLLGNEFLNHRFADADQGLLCFYVWGHAYQPDAYGDWESLEKFFEMIAGQEDVWYATNLEICAYMQALKEVVFDSEIGLIENSSCLDVWIRADGRINRIRGGQKVHVAKRDAGGKCKRTSALEV